MHLSPSLSTFCPITFCPINIIRKIADNGGDDILRIIAYYYYNNQVNIIISSYKNKLLRKIKLTNKLCRLEYMYNQDLIYTIFETRRIIGKAEYSGKSIDFWINKLYKIYDIINYCPDIKCDKRRVFYLHVIYNIIKKFYSYGENYEYCYTRTFPILYENTCR